MRKFTGKGDLTQGPIPKHLVRLSVPVIWGILAIISFQLVDTYYISLLGTEYLAGISFTFPVTMTVFSLIIGLGIGMSSVLSRKIGGGDHDEIIRIAGHGLILATMIGLCVALIGLLVMEPLFRVMGADEQMMEIITDYMVIWFAGVVFITVPIVGNSAIRATGDTLIPSITMMAAAGLNAIVAPFLIFGLWFFPRMEVQGAALATVISYILAMGLSLYVLYARKKLIFQGPFHLNKFADSARQVLSVALPAGLGSIIQPFTQGVLTAIMAGYGVHAVAAFGVASRIEAMAFVIVMALATGMSPILGQNMGAGKIRRVRETLRLSLSFCVGWSLFIALILGIFAKPLAATFSTDPEVIRYTVLYFWIVPVSYAAGNLVQGWASAFNAIGYPKKAAIMIIVKMLVLQIPLALLGGWLFGAVGVFVSIAAVNLATGLFFHLRAWADLQHEANAIGSEAEAPLG
ncbi:MAG: MATE family efflux transporter [Micavibrio sp.]